jgi:ribosomal protein L14
MDNTGVIPNPKGEMKVNAINGPIRNEWDELCPWITSNASAV